MSSKPWTEIRHQPMPTPPSGEEEPGDPQPLPARTETASPTPGAASTDIAKRLAYTDQVRNDLDSRTWTDAALFYAIHQHRGNLTAASQAIGLRSKSSVNHYAKSHPEFALALKKELEIAQATRHDLVIKTAYDLAIDGITKREYAANGQLIRSTIAHDPKHTAWMLERESPEHFHLPTRHEHTGAGGLPIRFKFEMDEGPLNPAEDEIEEAEEADWDDAA